METAYRNLGESDCGIATQTLHLREQFVAGAITKEELRDYVFTTGKFRNDYAYGDMLVGLSWRGVQQIAKRADETHRFVPSDTGVVLETIDKVRMSAGTVVYDIGAGIGKPSLLMGLLTEARVVGVEWEPSYCQIATDAARRIGLANVSFIAADALSLDYGDADVFYLYTPFWGRMLEQFVTQKLLPVARKKPITVAFHGPDGNPLLDAQWLVLDERLGPRRYRGQGGVRILRSRFE